jgi:endonuclease YncB( thermonuclease family)
LTADSTLYRYRAAVDHVIDGDTVVLEIDVGFSIEIKQRCRLYGCNARELTQPGGHEAYLFLIGLLPPDSSVVVRYVKADDYSGRFIGQLFLPDGRDVTQVMLTAGYAAPWDGRGAKPLPAWPIPIERAS